MTPIRRCALVTRFADVRAADSAVVLSRHLAGRGIEVVAPEEESPRLGDIAARYIPEATLADSADLVVAIGGDGTLLYAAGLVAQACFHRRERREETDARMRRRGGALHRRELRRAGRG